MGYFNDLPAENWISYLKAKKPIISFKTQKEREALQASLLVELPFLIGRNEISSALDRIDFGLYLDKDYFFERMKKQRVLRHSNYLEKLNPVGEIAGHLLDNQDFFKWSTKDKNFLSSLIEFKVFFEELSAINEFINEEIEDFRVPKKVVIDNGAFEASRIKCLLAKNDYYFLTDKQASRSCEKLTMLEFYTKEEISEAISLLVSKYNKKIGFRNSDLNLIDADYANSEICNKLIIESCRYKAIVELELEIEIYGYICTNQNGSQVIDHPDQNFSIAIELANIQYELQAASNAYGIYLNNQDALSVVDAANFYHKQFPDYFELKTYPFPRYTLAIRTDALEFLTGDEMEFFREELNILENIQKPFVL